MKFIDLTNKKFERLRVLNISKKGRGYWDCECNCGNITVVDGRHLKNGHTKSCGCLHREVVSLPKVQKYNIYNLTGEYGIGYMNKNKEFYFDLEDYDKIKNFYWRLSSNGYIVSTPYKQYFYLHRLIMNCNKDFDVDHIEHNLMDNRKNKLRVCLHNENMMNQGLRKNNKSGITGVIWNSYGNKWRAGIHVNGKRIYLGSFENFEDAVKARKDAEDKYFKEFKFKE